MKNSSKIISIAMTVATLLTSAQAFDIKLVGSYQEGKTWSDTKDASTFTKLDSNNIGIEIGHYKNTNLEGFGFGWHVGFSSPVNFNSEASGDSYEVGIAPGYSITPELALKLELGLALKTGRRVKTDTQGVTTNENVPFVGPSIGLSVEYVVAEHYVLGAAGKYWVTQTSSSSEDSSYAFFVPEISFGYRF